MSTITIGKALPDLEVATTQGTKTLSDWKNSNLVLYFYPKDDTPGCTREAEDFRDHLAKFKKLNTEVVGVSRDNLNKHEKFCQKYQLPFALISDDNETLCQLFDVIREKTNYGRKYLGIDRSTFLFDATGVLRHEWRSVKVDGHVEAVLAQIKSL